MLLWSLVNVPDQQFKNRPSHDWFWGFARWALTVGGNIVTSDEKFPFKLYMFIYTQTYKNYSFLIANNMISYYCFRYHCCYVTLLILYLSPSLHNKKNSCVPFLLLRSVVSCYLSLCLLLPHASTQAIVPFYFPSFCSYYKICTHIWRYRSRSLRLQRKWGVCLSVYWWPHSVWFFSSIHLPAKFMI